MVQLTTTSRFGAAALLAGAVTLVGLLAAPAADGAACPAGVCTETFQFSGHVETFTVPPGVTSLTATLDGAAGGEVFQGAGDGKKGGETTATVAVQPGEVLSIVVGQRGAPNATPAALTGSYGGGGAGGVGQLSGDQLNGGGGGGGTFLFGPGGTPWLIAGGGGGFGAGWGGGEGAGAGTTANTGGPFSSDGAEGGRGATESAPGAGGGGNPPGGAGTGPATGPTALGDGGSGAPGSDNMPQGAGGGGGGYFGGGGGGALVTDGGGGGGGGSGFAFPGASEVHGTTGAQTGDGQLTLTWVERPLAITTTDLPDATVGAAYSTGLDATGGVAPLSWSITRGTLPGGLHLDAATGKISGTPTLTGTVSLTVTVTDSVGSAVSKALTLTITAAPSSTAPSSAPASTPGSSSPFPTPSSAPTSAAGSGSASLAATGIDVAGVVGLGGVLAILGSALLAGSAYGRRCPRH
jgi:hypothetical protein